MPYITSWERIGKKKGILEERQKILTELIRERFGKMPRDISKTVKQINDIDILKSLLMHTLKCHNLDSFREVLHQKNLRAA